MNGEVKVMVRNDRIYEQLHESLALLKILALSSASIKKGKYKPAQKAFEDIRKKIAGKRTQ